ncbi:MAG: response regulator [Anaerolineae bacterium]|nr:MAG: response regulator [Anaerolineae bacterium]
MKRVLIVEDNPELSSVFSDLLTDNQFEVRVAMNGLEAVDTLNDFSPDIILLDVHMPILSGLEVLTYTRENPALDHTRIIMMTGDFRIEQMPEARLVDRFLVKPVHLADVLTLTRQLASENELGASVNDKYPGY